MSGPCTPPKQRDPAGAGAGGDASHASPPAAPLCLAPSLREGNLTWRLLLPSELMERGSTRYFFFLFSLGCFSTELQLTLAACSGCQRRSPATAMWGQGHHWDVGIWSQRIDASLYSQEMAAQVLLSPLYSVQIRTPRPFPGSPRSSRAAPTPRARAGPGATQVVNLSTCSQNFFHLTRGIGLARSPVPLSPLGLRPKLGAKAVLSGTGAPGGRREQSGSPSAHGAAQRAQRGDE